MESISDGSAAKKELDSKGFITLSISIGDIELTADDLLITATQMDDSFSLSDNGFTVSLDTKLTDELIAEGYVRELISKIQTMRKDSDFNVTDHIKVGITAGEKLSEIVAANAAEIAGDVLADSVAVNEAYAISKEWDINGEKAVISVEVVK